MADFTVEQRDPRDLTPNPLNWRRHPQTQREVLAYSLEKFGFVQGAIWNARTQRLIDGHARVEEAIEQGRETIPVNVVDMSEEDERELLRLFDPIGSLAETDTEALDRLIAEIGNPDLEAMLSGIGSGGGGLLVDDDEGVEPDVEFYSPAFVIEAARSVMGGIDLDPASCALANETVKADRYFTRRDDGLSQEWQGRIWLNPPFFAGSYEEWFVKLCKEHDEGRVTQSCLLMPVSDGRWFHDLLQQPTCFLFGRQEFMSPEGEMKEPIRYGCVVTYRGDKRADFFREFATLGTVVTRVPGTGRSAELIDD